MWWVSSLRIMVVCTGIDHEKGCTGMLHIVESALNLSGKGGQVPVSHTIMDLDGTVQPSPSRGGYDDPNT
jgi:hypothetical protein